MEKKRSFLGFLATLFVAFFTANAFAAGYSCPTYKLYTLCSAGYYLNGSDAGNSCEPCKEALNTTSSTANITNGTRTETCTGYYMGGTEGSNGVSQCIGCSVYSYSTTCNTGYTATNGTTSSSSCTANTYTIAYNANGGTGTTASSSHTYGVSKALTANGFTNGTKQFLGWSTSSSATSATYTNGQSVSNLTTTNGETVTLYAVWGTCTACRAGTGATCSLSAPKGVCTYTTRCKTGYSNISNNGKYNPSCSANTLTINYNTNGATSGAPSASTQTCSYDGTCTAASQGTMLKTNSVFLGWATSDTATVAQYAAGASIKNIISSGSTTLYAVWSACKDCSAGTGATCSLSVSSNTCTYTTACKDGYSSLTNSGKYNPSCTANNYSIALNHVDATTDGTTTIYTTYNTNVYSDSTRSKAMTTSANGITIPKRVYTVTYDANGGSVSTTSATATYTFNGYYKSSSDTTAYIGSNGFITSDGLAAGKAMLADTTWYAKWASKSVTLPTPTRTGYTFKGWGTSDTATSGSTGSYTPTKDITLYAIWSQNTYNVAYSCGDGSGTAPASTTATYGASFTPATNTCTRSGYNFAGWTVSGTSDTKTAGSAFTWTYTESKTFTAKWTAEGETEINYDTNGGTINGSYVAACNVETATFNLPTDVTRAGYTFNGWYTASTGGTKVTSVVKGTCTSALTYYAQWTACDNTTAGACNCTSSQYPDNGTCTNCSHSCTSVTGYTLGTYNVCNAETDSICYRACTTGDVPNSGTVSGTVTKGGTSTCKATSCASDDYYLTASGGCQSCPENATCGGNADWECDTGYKKTANGLGCQPKTYTVTLNANGGTGGTASVTATYNSLLPTATMPTRTNYNFVGYYDTDATTGGNQYYDASGTPVKTWTTDGTGTLYARWKLGVFTCTAGKAADGTTCTPGYYCPGGNVTAGNEDSETEGCEIACPSASGKTISSVSGATLKTQCTAAGDVDITNESKTVVSGSGTETCNWNDSTGTYSSSCNTVPTYCQGGYYRPAANSPFCNEVDYGYYRGDSEAVTTRNACSALSGASGATTKTTTSSAATACFNMCLQTVTTDGNGVLNPVNENEFYNATTKTIAACSYTLSCNTGYRAASDTTCEPDVFAITLNHNGGTGSVNTIYLKYNTGWYSDSNATSKITKVTLPTLAGQTCSGYLSGSTVVIGSTGNLTTNYTLFSDDATIKASYADNPSISCAAGTYYAGTGTSCTNCPAGSYCEGVEAIQDTGTASGIATCAALNGTYTAAVDKNGNKLTVTISSAAKSDAAADCYATNVAYAPDQYTAGSQTCRYDESTKSYTANCSAKTVITCAGGYALASSDATVCTIVGLGYYSPDKETTATQCPINSDTGTYGTTQEKGRTSAEACIMDDLWYENDTSGQRRQCFYSAESGKYDRNCPQSTIVTCIAGYYYDASQSTTDCVQVDNGYWSPAQSECSGESAQPTVAGCSTKRNSCGEGIDTKDADGNIIYTASSITYCEGLCEAGYYCVPGEEAKECPADYPESQPGATDISQCYKSGTMTCINPGIDVDCPENALSCAYITDVDVSCKTYYNTTTCEPDDGDGICEVEPVSVSCKANHYNDDGQCLSCADIPGSDGAWKYSYGGTGGTEICHSKCSFACDASLLCPELATCTNVSNTINGGKFYPNTVCEPYEWLSCAITFTCPDGYTARMPDGTDTSDLGSCDPNTYTITLDDTDGSGGTGEIFQLYKSGWYSDADTTSDITTVKTPALEHYSFLGYYTAETNGTKVIDSDGTILSGPTFLADTTLYAQWSQNVETCEAGKYYDSGVLTECVAPYYCPGEGTVVVGGTGCRATCPNGGTIDEDGAFSINRCHKIITDSSKNFPNGTAQWDCYYTSGTGDNALYSTSCKVVPRTCNAGYYHEGNDVVGCTVVENMYYSPADDLKKHLCEGGDGSVLPRDSQENCYVSCDLAAADVPHSKTVTPDSEQAMYSGDAYETCTYTLTCETGYTAVPGANPQCKANEYTITLDKNNGTGNIANSVQCTFDSGACALPATSSLVRPGYNVIAKWCKKADGTGDCYGAGNTITDNISATGTDVTLYAVWEPAVFKVTLSATDATANGAQGPVYLKYATGWFADESANTAITSLGDALPQKTGYEFAGYKLGDISIINSDGALQTNENALSATTVDATATAVWSAGFTSCAAGTYYSGNGSVCLVCTENNWCPGGDKFATDSGTPDGLNACPNGGLSAGGESATNVGVCYKEQLPYTSASTHATGTQTCYYGTDDYNANCKDIVVTACVAGYYYVSGTDCSEVGADHYSGADDMKRYACPNGGGTGSLTTASVITECFKTVDFTSASGNGTGTQVCTYTSGEGADARYATECREQYVNHCKGGYYKTTDDAIDCDVVGKNYYSPEGDVARKACPDGGLTESETANAPTFCYKTDTPYSSEHGRGIQLCYYNAETTVYDTGCSTIIMHECDAGYYWKNGDKDCEPVDYGFYGPVADVNNSNRPTTRDMCPDNGLTKTNTSADISECYRTDVECTVNNGVGEATCNYDADAGAYSANCGTCAVTGCGEGYYSTDGTNCVECPAGSICDGGDDDGDGIPDAKTCASLTGGTHTKSDTGISDVSLCYTDCPVVENANSVTGRDYYGATDTCKINSCQPGYKLQNFQCVACAEGEICDGTVKDEDGDGNQDEEPKTCTELTGGTHTMSDAKSDSINDCYHMCEAYELDGGMAVPVSERAQYPDDCEFKGISDTGNPCDIVDGRCVETSCNSNFELINGSCKPCNREHAITYKPTGNCVVESCATGYHPNGQACEDDVVSCSAPNAISATQVWNTKKNAFGECIITECDDGYHLVANACQVDEQPCEVEHGTGMREWNHNTNTWGACVATSCEPGYTSDRSLTNELSKQCGRCNNMYSALGELAASSYVSECEIASCMYQGEKYTLENNECVLICDTRSDETGSQKWNASRGKCERTCADGYIEW